MEIWYFLMKVSNSVQKVTSVRHIVSGASLDSRTLASALRWMREVARSKGLSRHQVTELKSLYSTLVAVVPAKVVEDKLVGDGGSMIDKTPDARPTVADLPAPLTHDQKKSKKVQPKPKAKAALRGMDLSGVRTLC